MGADGVAESDELVVKCMEALPFGCGQILLARQMRSAFGHARLREEERVGTQTLRGRQLGIGRRLPRADCGHGNPIVVAEPARQHRLGQALSFAQVPKSPGESYGLW